LQGRSEGSEEAAGERGLPSLTPAVLYLMKAENGASLLPTIQRRLEDAPFDDTAPDAFLRPLSLASFPFVHHSPSIEAEILTRSKDNCIPEHKVVGTWRSRDTERRVRRQSLEISDESTTAGGGLKAKAETSSDREGVGWDRIRGVPCRAETEGVTVVIKQAGKGRDWDCLARASPARLPFLPRTITPSLGIPISTGTAHDGNEHVRSIERHPTRTSARRSSRRYVFLPSIPLAAASTAVR
jgi:hypothetical protein